ncbi:FKBP-type peptidyl-prolyl cis-trans isomerase [Alteraurantiacibacter aquimixticola]|uniref:Peptidyl-prolyl cis-trans isomerase n=1 Tax=Alteraurantiacibacter aquimixticola TaxID=2489173 RepID=A0A4T3F6K1_9SPHN|nr:FKBP-type peptidyl-prolyl cis-trans isomerase [Alteraurantiacibacter aquimixticola]TIX51302.1 peptidylprolyl isomerase [Alteraurantiacibacter aquimixticola]
MAEVTRVPLQPIAKGSLMKFWLGVLVGALLAGAVAWFVTRPDTVSVTTLTAGEGPTPQEGDAVFVDYVGTLEDGTEFDRSPPMGEIPEQIRDLIPQGSYMELDGVVPGFREGLLQMQKGGTYRVEIPSEMAYGPNPPPGSPIPANADLTFEVTLHEFMTQEQLQARADQINAVMAEVMAAEGLQAPE